MSALFVTQTIECRKHLLYLTQPVDILDDSVTSE